MPRQAGLARHRRVNLFTSKALEEARVVELAVSGARAM